MSILGEEYGELCQAVNESCFENGRHPELGGVDNVIKEAVSVAEEHSGQQGMGYGQKERIYGQI